MSQPSDELRAAVERVYTPSELLFSEVWIRSLRGWNAINAFREAAEKGIPLAGPEIHATYLKVAQSFTQPDANRPGEAPVLPGLRPEEIAEMAEQTAGGILRSAASAVHAATIVFSHSVLDAAAYGYCKVTRVIDANAWETVVERRPVELSSVRRQDYETLRDIALDRYFEELERESLLKKVDLLHARCQPAAGWRPLGGYAYDRDRLLQLDNLRHDVVHGDTLLRGVPVFGLAEIDFCMDTGTYFMALVNMRYGVRLRPDFMARLSDPPATP